MENTIISSSVFTTILKCSCSNLPQKVEPWKANHTFKIKEQTKEMITFECPNCFTELIVYLRNK